MLDTLRAWPLTHTAADLVALMKPGVSCLVLATTAGGLFLAPGSPVPALVFYTLFGTLLLVGAANVLNMYIERDVDALMCRTKNRPLPAKRLAPETALWFGVGLAAVAMAVLTVGVNPLTAFLGVIAFVAYVLFYTPLKQKTTLALLVGAVPGAMPPLMGWTSGTGSLGLGGLSLFAILFFWQIPHFLAIALCNKEEYARAGIKVLPLEKGEGVTRHAIVRSISVLVPVTLVPYLLRMGGAGYLWVALILGAGFFVWGLFGLNRDAGARWARGFFLASILYLPVLLAVLVLAA